MYRAIDSASSRGSGLKPLRDSRGQNVKNLKRSLLCTLIKNTEVNGQKGKKIEKE